MKLNRDMNWFFHWNLCPLELLMRQMRSALSAPRCPWGSTANFVTIRIALACAAGNWQETQAKEVDVADTKKVADKAERKQLKRTARKKAAPKAKRTTPRGSQKQKVKKLARGQSKR